MITRHMRLETPVPNGFICVGTCWSDVVGGRITGCWVTYDSNPDWGPPLCSRSERTFFDDGVWMI